MEACEHRRGLYPQDAAGDLIPCWWIAPWTPPNPTSIEHWADAHGWVEYVYPGGGVMTHVGKRAAREEAVRHACRVGQFMADSRPQTGYGEICRFLYDWGEDEISSVLDWSREASARYRWRRSLSVFSSLGDMPVDWCWTDYGEEAGARIAYHRALTLAHILQQTGVSIVPKVDQRNGCLEQGDREGPEGSAGDAGGAQA